MKPLKDIKKIVTKFNVKPRPEMRSNILDEALEIQKNKQSTSDAYIWRIIMKSKITRFTAAAASIIIVTGIVLSILGTGTPTFAQVIEPILNARTVAFDPVIHDIVKDSLIRRTFSNMETILIIDLENSKMLTLNPQQNIAAYGDIEGPLKEATRSYLRLVRDIIVRLEDSPDWHVKELNLKVIDGTRAVGFHVTGGDQQLIVWADLEMAVPIRIELLRGQSVLAIFKNIEFNVPVDDSLVSMNVPDGYTLHQGELNLSDFNEQDFIETLRMWADLLLDGRFPDNLTTEEILKQVPVLGEKIDELDISDEDKMQLGMHLGRGIIFYQMLAHQREYHYGGKGVKLGDAQKAIFWYQPEGSQAWRVIYGDLSVKEVDEENLPK
ncbi:MAG: hypothetical protein ACYSR3_03755 [Planctomycetota bacterium]|jgi:hypothetical protein